MPYLTVTISILFSVIYTRFIYIYDLTGVWRFLISQEILDVWLGLVLDSRMFFFTKDCPCKPKALLIFCCVTFSPHNWAICPWVKSPCCSTNSRNLFQSLIFWPLPCWKLTIALQSPVSCSRLSQRSRACHQLNLECCQNNPFTAIKSKWVWEPEFTAGRGCAANWWHALRLLAYLWLALLTGVCWAMRERQLSTIHILYPELSPYFWLGLLTGVCWAMRERQLSTIHILYPELSPYLRRLTI